MKMSFSRCLAIAAAVTMSSFAQAENFTVDTVHSNVGFSIAHLTVSKVKGQFKTFSGSWSVDGDTRKLTDLNIKIDVSSVDTDNKDRDDHLRNPDFFDAAKFPEMTFRFAKYEETSPGVGKVIGQLTMRGKTQPIEVMAEVSGMVENPWKAGKKKSGLSLTAVVPRLDYGVGEKFGESKVGEQVKVSIELEGDN